LNNVPISFAVDNNTAFQGVAGISALSAGSLVNFDVAVQADGTLRATRIAAYDPSAQNILEGTVTQQSSPFNSLTVSASQQLGAQLSPEPVSGSDYITDQNTIFQTAPQVANLQSLPFTASFGPTSISAGQRVAVTADAIALLGGTHTAARSVTLVPQTVDGTISSIGSAGSFTVYTLVLGSQDPISSLNVATSVTAYVGPARCTSAVQRRFWALRYAAPAFSSMTKARCAWNAHRLTMA